MTESRHAVLLRDVFVWPTSKQDERDEFGQIGTMTKSKSAELLRSDIVESHSVK